MTAQHNELSTPRQAEATASQFQAAAARIAAHLAGAPGEFARDDIAWLWTELERRQHELAARDADLQRAQAALQMSEARLSLMQEGVNAGIWDWEPQADNVTVTARVESLHGLPSGALQHYQDWRQRIHPDDIERVEAERDAAIAEHRAFAVEFRVDAGDGEMRWIAGRGRAIYNEDGQVVRIVGINQDITERKLAELGLLEERANMQALLENTGGSIWSVDTNYCLIAGNSVFHRDTYAAFGRPFASGDLLLTQDGPSDAIAVWKARYNRALGGETFTVETQRLFGRPVWTEYRFNPIRSASGAITGVTVFGRDITERKQAEQQIREQLAEITFYYDNAPIGLAVLDTDLRFVRINKLLAEANGVPAADHIGRTAAEIVPDLVAQGRTLAARILATGEPITEFEISGETAAQPGVVRYWSEGWYPIKGDDQAIIGFSVIAQEITERKLAEDALWIAHQRLDEHIDNSPLAVIEFDPTFRVIRWSQGATRIFGWRPEEILGRAISELHWVHDEDIELVRQTSEAMLTGRNRRNLNVNRNYRKDGVIIHCEWYNSAVYDDNGRLISVMSQVLDITERVHTEEERARLHARLAEAHKMETVGRLAGGVAHEFNNLLAVILLRAEMSLSLVEPGSTLERNFTTILATAQRSAELVRQLLGFARKQVIDPKVIELNAVIEATLPMLRKLVGEEIKLIWQQEAFLWPIKMDQTQIDQILANLCVNACDAIDGAGAITIETSNVSMTQDEAGNASVAATGDYVLLSVTDTGHGMDHATLAHVFEPFFTTKEVGKGTGLGLPMVEGIMQQNHGHIQVLSEPDRGTTIKLYFPRHLESPVSAATNQPAMPLVGQHETVLLVEDEPILLQMSTDVLEFLGYGVITAASPQEALQAVENYPGKIDLVMTDIVMPEMNGIELVAHMTATHPGIKRLFVSGYPADYIAHRGVLEDDVHFLQKPYTLHALAAKLREVLDNTGHEASPYLP